MSSSGASNTEAENRQWRIVNAECASSAIVMAIWIVKIEDLGDDRFESIRSNHWMIGVPKFDHHFWMHQSEKQGFQLCDNSSSILINWNETGRHFGNGHNKCQQYEKKHRFLVDVV